MLVGVRAPCLRAVFRCAVTPRCNPTEPSSRSRGLSVVLQSYNTPPARAQATGSKRSTLLLAGAVLSLTAARSVHASSVITRAQSKCSSHESNRFESDLGRQIESLVVRFIETKGIGPGLFTSNDGCR
eukprot:1178636-Prorocentrum_minimum.AAC.2